MNKKFNNEGKSLNHSIEAMIYEYFLNTEINKFKSYSTLSELGYCEQKLIDSLNNDQVNLFNDFMELETKYYTLREEELLKYAFDCIRSIFVSN